jgi:hypothetical protein
VDTDGTLAVAWTTESDGGINVHNPSGQLARTIPTARQSAVGLGKVKQRRQGTTGFGLDQVFQEGLLSIFIFDRPGNRVQASYQVSRSGDSLEAFILGPSHRVPHQPAGPTFAVQYGASTSRDEPMCVS